MKDFDVVLSEARELTEQDQERLIDALVETLPPDCEFTFSDEWLQEIERRGAELHQGTVQTVPWVQIRDEALERLGRGTTT